MLTLHLKGYQVCTAINPFLKLSIERVSVSARMNRTKISSSPDVYSSRSSCQRVTKNNDCWLCTQRQKCAKLGENKLALMVEYTLFVRLGLQLEIDNWSCKPAKELNWSTQVGGQA